MSLTVQTAATSRRLTTAQAVYADTGDVHYLEEPTLANSLIDQASAAIESWCGRIFAQQRYVEVLGQVRDLLLPLRMRPIVAVETLLAGTDAVTDYRVEDKEAGLLYRRDRWGYPSAVDDLTITYIAGYILPEQTTPPAPTGPTLPADLQRACIECVKIWFAERVPESRIEARTLGDQTIRYNIQSSMRGLPKLTQQILMPYKQWVIR
jgi:hypothetical protein